MLGLLLLLAALAVAGSSIGSEPHLGPGSFTAQVNGIVADPELQRIADAFAKAKAKDPAWFADYARDHPVAPLPWHAKLGVSEPEWKLVTEEGQARLALLPMGAVPLVLEHTLTGLRIHANGRWPVLDDLGLVVAPDGATMETVFGRLVASDPPVPSAFQLPGPWSGRCWKLPETDLARERASVGTLMLVCLGTLEASDGGRILSYESRRPGDKRPAANADMVLLFD
jgi:hypothetical protein